MRRHHWVALGGALGILAISFTDAVTQVVTGHDSIFATGSGHPIAGLGSNLVHGLCYAGLAGVLHAERPRFSTAGRAVRVARTVLLVVCAAMAVGFLVVSQLITQGAVAGTAVTVYDATGTPLLFAMILASTVIGLGVLRRNPLGLGGRILRWLLPTVALTVLAAVVVPEVAHPFAIEAVLNFGVALIGIRAVTPDLSASTSARSGTGADRSDITAG